MEQSLCFPSAFSSPDSCVPCTRPQANANVYRTTELPEELGPAQRRGPADPAGSPVSTQLGAWQLRYAASGGYLGGVFLETRLVCVKHRAQLVMFRSAPSITGVALLQFQAALLPAPQTHPASRFLEGLSPDVLLRCRPARSFEERDVRSVRDLGSRHRPLGHPGRKLDGVETRGAGPPRTLCLALVAPLSVPAWSTNKSSSDVTRGGGSGCSRFQLVAMLRVS